MYDYSRPLPPHPHISTKGRLLLTSQTFPLGGRVQGDYPLLVYASHSQSRDLSFYLLLLIVLFRHLFSDLVAEPCGTLRMAP